jgi:hydroxylaminobenzene mutase
MALTLDRNGRSLVVAGAVLFLAGLLQGFVVDQFANPRMALSAHLDAVQSGMAVMLAGAFWSTARWSRSVESVARSTLAAGMVGLWGGITLAALTGASEALPMAGEGFAAGPGAELATTATIISSSIALALGWGLFVVGLVRGR